MVYTPIQTITLVGGEGLATFPLTHGDFKGIVIQPQTASTTFDWEVIDSHSLVRLDGSKLSSQPRVSEEFSIAVRGAFTVRIFNGSVNEEMIIEPSIIELYGR